MATSTSLPSLPPLGRPERFYKEHVNEADRYGDRHAHEAYKVGFYISRAQNYTSDWEEKLHCFQHALKHHCSPPLTATPEVVSFYSQLAHMVREQAGQEALRIASRKDDEFAALVAEGIPRAQVVKDARAFFTKLLHSTHRPDWMNLADYEQIVLLQHYWS